MRNWLIERLGKARLLRWVMTLYPPYLGAGISVQHMSADFRHVKVRMGLGWYNRNSAAACIRWSTRSTC